MAKYLDTSQITSELMLLLKEAKEKIILVSYSLQVNNQIQERLKTKSKLGTLSEISIIYGNTTLKDKELKWMEEIEDLRVFQKKNLHAKCYINENKAIIASMNLYDYSQTTNIEMGFLIDRKTDPEAYGKMMEDIDDLKINGIRKKWNSLEEVIHNSFESEEVIKKQVEILPISLSYRQQVQKMMLEFFRNDKSQQIKQKSNSILPDEAIEEIIKSNQISKFQLQQILKSKKKVDQLGDEILNYIQKSFDLVLGVIEDTRYQNDDFSYDQIKMKLLETNQSYWFDTKQELPQKGQIVAVELNGNWFNGYIILEKSDVQDTSTSVIKKDYSKSNYKTTKELSNLSGLSSREINSILVDLKLMDKNGDDWHTSKKGEKFGGIQKEGKYGKFIVWPEDIMVELQIK